ncbi:MAG: hypothetical protein LBG17_01885 [Bacteroidales bacterium]|jgi:hypothetical protein|nr:hypothetical protein [Bacteroidales bacterium]
MKKIILFAAFIIGAHCGFAQNNDVSQLTDSTGNAGLKHLFAQKNEVLQFTKEKAIAAVEEAIATIKANYLYMYFGYPKDTEANINQFIDNISKAAPVSKEKGDKIKKLILDKIKRKSTTISVYQVLRLDTWYDLPDFILIMGINADDILLDCFDYSDYKNICSKLETDKIFAKKAYDYLETLYKRIEHKWEVHNMLKEYRLNSIFKYYGITRNEP